MRRCKGYIGSACVDGSCPRAQENEDGQSLIASCDHCWYYQGCDDCAAPYYGCCPEGKVEAEGGEKMNEQLAELHRELDDLEETMQSIIVAVVAMDAQIGDLSKKLSQYEGGEKNE